MCMGPSVPLRGQVLCDLAVRSRRQTVGELNKGLEATFC